MASWIRYGLKNATMAWEFRIGHPQTGRSTDARKVALM